MNKSRTLLDGIHDGLAHQQAVFLDPMKQIILANALLPWVADVVRQHLTVAFLEADQEFSSADVIRDLSIALLKGTPNPFGGRELTPAELEKFFRDRGEES